MQQDQTPWASASVRNRLSIRLVALILLCNGLLAVINTGFLLYLDYEKDLASVNENFVNVENSFADPVSASLWYLDKEQVKIQLEGILTLGNMHYVSVREAGAESSAGTLMLDLGERPNRYELTHEIPLIFRDESVGTLFLSTSMESIYFGLVRKYAWVLLSQLVKTLIISLGILLIMYYLVIRHINRIADYTAHLRLQDMNENLKLERTHRHEDVLDTLTRSINDMRRTMKNDVDVIENAHSHIEELNLELENKVEERTAQLEKSNAHLKQTIEELQSTKDKLVEAETMAALGGLVTGVAHEINTPLGISVTAASQTQNTIQKLLEQAEKKQLTREEFNHNLALLKTLNDLMNSNLQRVAKLVSSFKQVSVDQYSHEHAEVKFKQFVNETIDGLQYKYPNVKFKVDIQCEDTFKILQHHDALSLILTHMIQNSVEHGFDDRISNPAIQLTLIKSDVQIDIHYKDNGIGMSEEVKEKVFNPFFTTKRNMGFSGLGSHVTYNLVTHLLKGHIELVEDVESGVHFAIRIPLGSLS